MKKTAPMDEEWILPVQSAATVLIVSGVATFSLVCGVDARQEVQSATTKPAVVSLTGGTSLVVDELLPNAIRFKELVSAWHEQRQAMSWITEMAICPAYQSIIAMGPAAVRFILTQLQSEGDEPDHWFWALRVLTGANPVAEEDRGDLVKMSRAWLNWGTERG